MQDGFHATSAHYLAGTGTKLANLEHSPLPIVHMPCDLVERRDIFTSFGGCIVKMAGVLYRPRSFLVDPSFAARMTKICLLNLVHL